MMIPAMRNAQATHVDFGFLRGIIRDNPNFMPSNIDMVLERKGSFLFGEWKRDGEDMKYGQKLLLKELACIHRVLVITGYVDTQAHIDLIQEVSPISGNLKTVGKSVADLIKYIQDWYNDAEEDFLQWEKQ
ncbi:hypothetical protein UFOVP146_9 [uncultured Caudovirales phage]|uniref:Uncharacterized protein n=1 Tax=uncultured Caudovirales phage TaxID=2100421 RepID=A0A6J7VKW2_9CAUD|nr:hypothetical protein UFOVP146_9 [uncultured Caudovirales phage]